ncbi:hypothetical protein F8388_025305 [Cannabis sativa]|uniref:Reverse transcriptase zinc-binding domain-containing protein n=1 Tax=Cannabis sativa TaxID=3483 RepID=A0A7J6FSA4_CANSA|nr:hypothetical protein F8388_025305 [Cannabis sativa]
MMRLSRIVSLRIKRVQVSNLCPVCNLEEETITHCLVSCSLIKQVWERTGIGTNLSADLSWTKKKVRKTPQLASHMLSHSQYYRKNMRIII